jgi:hypothetical protein
MPELTAPDSTSVGITRLGRSAATTDAELGPLADLVGTWIGSHGWEMIAVPSGPDTFRLIARPYVEVITVEEIGAPVPNRGGSSPDLFITGLMYQTRITDRETGEPLHLENGMWLNLGKSQEKPIVRQASIPHGDVFLALGDAEVTEEAPKIPELNGRPESGPDTPFGYTDTYTPVKAYEPSGGIEEFSPTEPGGVLEKQVEGLNVVKTTTLSVSTEDDGGIVNIPFVEREAKVSKFSSTYWVETIKDPETGNEVQQLQYAQQSDLEFIPKFGEPGLIVWPHINVNTLRKQ